MSKHKNKQRLSALRDTLEYISNVTGSVTHTTGVDGCFINMDLLDDVVSGLYSEGQKVRFTSAKVKGYISSPAKLGAVRFCIIEADAAPTTMEVDNGVTLVILRAACAEPWRLSYISKPYYLSNQKLIPGSEDTTMLNFNFDITRFLNTISDRMQNPRYDEEGVHTYLCLVGMATVGSGDITAANGTLYSTYKMMSNNIG